MKLCGEEPLRGFIRLCSDGSRNGWHELNGGNLSYRMTAAEFEHVRPYCMAQAEWTALGVPVRNLAGEGFVVTGTGCFLRNVELSPEENLGVVEISGTGDAYRVVWGLRNGGRPTSELQGHLLCHSVRKTATGGKNRVIYHAHAPCVVALTHVLPLADKSFTRALWHSLTECILAFSAGVGVLPWMRPGSRELALESCRSMEKREAVVWAFHGAVCAGESLDMAFGLMESMEKAADICLRAMSCGAQICQNLPVEALRTLAESYGKKIEESFLE
jgi:rhamnulose-1-phosphate aldolase